MSAFLDNFYYEIHGQPQKGRLVFLHGLMGFTANWRRIVSAFQNEYEILAFDQRGHGKSFKPQVGYRPEDYADDLVKILDELNWPKISCLIGHSMGGRNAMNFAYRFPERLQLLVIEDIAPDGNRDSILKFENLFKNIPTPFSTKLAAKEFLMNELEEPSLGTYLYSNIIETTTGLYDWRFSKEAMLASVREGRARARWEEAQGLKMPTLIIRGSDSKDLSRENFQRMLSCNSKIEGVEIEKAGHWVHFDQPEAFFSSLRTFLKKNSQ